MKKRIFLSLFIIHISLVACAQSPQKDSTWIANHYSKLERMISMRDGIKLFTAIYIPKDESEKHPILLMRTPYSCAPYGENKYTDRYSSRGDSVYFQRNYILVW